MSTNARWSQRNLRRDRHAVITSRTRRRPDAVRAVAETITPAKTSDEVREAKSAGGKKAGRGRGIGSAASAAPKQKPKGDSAKRLTERIARDRPDVLERMKAGEFQSVRRAAIPSP